MIYENKEKRKVKSTSFYMSFACITSICDTWMQKNISNLMRKIFDW
jgi:hypothetical protein